MGKQGPCFHCGVTSTPLWRNGPPEKPVLCNACGSRWRTKGTLANYTPLHARAESDDFEDYKIPKVKNLVIKTKETKLYKRKQNHDSFVVKREAPDYEQNFRRGIEEDTSNRSSSGSAISYSESCAQFGGTDASELTGSAQSIVWDTLVPSKKRTCVSRPKPSSVEKLTKDLYSILHEQQQSSYFSGSSEEELLFESEAPMVSVEIGHGSVLMKHPNSAIRDEESEASSFSIDNKSNTVNEVYSGSAASASFPVHTSSKGFNCPSVGIDKIRRPLGPGVQSECSKSDKSHKEKSQILQNRKSPLRSIDLKDVVSFEEFVKHFTLEEQQLLMKHLPSTDTARLPDSLKSMFSSAQFAENLSSFQQLLAEGVFDLSFSGMNTEECKTLKKLALVNLTKSKWVEHYNLLKDVKGKQSTGGKGVATGSNVLGSNNLLPVKRPRDPQNQNFPEPKAVMKSPKRLFLKAGYETKDLIENDGSCFSPRSLFAFPPDRSSLMLDCFNFTDDSSDQDLLFDVPPNGSFPQAELLHPSSSFSSQQASTSSSVICPHLTNP
ncbi:zinc finger protein [Macleaya cordata]|uniref:Zinc finger protein n=1 Tax=Macleaya cordata TaxID=56857 RepID=A0A200QLK5_MACCD|nr:zinc finger protein [Macleaya cordata]